MQKFVHYFFFLLLLTDVAWGQHKWQLNLNNQYKAAFEAAYRQYPDIPKGILESIAYSNTHLNHLIKDSTTTSEIPFFHGVMGLVEDGKGYFRNNLLLVARLSGQPVQSIKNNPSTNILAYAKAFHILAASYQIQSNNPEDYIKVLNELSELPSEGVEQHSFALDCQLYSIFQNINDATFQAATETPQYSVDLEKVFGTQQLKILSSNSIILDDSGIRTQAGEFYQSLDYRQAPPPCGDLSAGFPYTVIQDAADPANYGSRTGTPISHIAIHTTEASYAATIAWFKNPASIASAHYVVRSADGQITQMVCENENAFHTTSVNNYTIGIEHEGFSNDPSWYTDICYTTSAELTKDIAGRYGISLERTYDINGDNSSNPISDACYQIKGHQHYFGETATDPGQHWDWNRYYDLLNPTASATSTTYTASSGSLFDSGGLIDDYGNDERIFYRIEPVGASSVSLTFNSMDIELNYDFLYVYDGDSPNDALIAVLTGNSIPATLTANSGKMLLEFRSDCSITEPGWEANWTSSTAAVSCPKTDNLMAIDQNQNSATLTWDPIAGAQTYEIRVRQSIATASWTTYYSSDNSFDLTGLAADARYLWTVRCICGPGDTSVVEGSEFINAEPTTDETSIACSGRFTDSGGAFGQYNNNEDYTFTIAPTNATSVTLTFTAFDIEANFDFMYIYDGSSTAATLIGTYTGNTLPPVINSSGGALTIRFTSDFSISADGWQADWTCVSTLPTLGNPILLNTTMLGNLDCGRSFHDFYDSGNSGGAYGNNEDYIQTFCNPDPTKAIRLTFRPNPTADQQLSINSALDGNDYLYFYNGTDTNANLIGVYTGASSAAAQPGSFVSSGQCLTVRIKTNNSLVGAGWLARLFCSDPPQSLASVEVGGTEGSKVFTDQGGTSSNYLNNQNYTVTYCPHASAPAGEVVWAEFTSTVGLEKNWDYLYVFDGMDTENSKLLCAYTGNGVNANQLETIKATIENSSGCLTFQFYSDGATSASGWQANVYTGDARLGFGGESCSNATLIDKIGKDYAGGTTLATGEPGTQDPALNISLATLPECSGTNTITRLENSVWYRFFTPNSACVPLSMDIVLDNISCQGEGTNGSGLQLALYEANNCGQPFGSPIYCADKLLSGHNVDVLGLLNPSQEYYIMIDGFTGQHCNFDLRYDLVPAANPNDCTLPLELLSFNGLKEAQFNLLSWETAQEVNVYGFYLERSTDGIIFDEIAFIPSMPTNANQGNSYQYEDYNYISYKTNYYRLRSVDNDGSENRSSIISLDRNQDNPILLKVFPNPTDENIFFSMDATQEQNYELRILNATGQLVVHHEGRMMAGNWVQPFNTTSLAAGMYFYQFSVAKQTLNGKFEKL